MRLIRFVYQSITVTCLATATALGCGSDGTASTPAGAVDAGSSADASAGATTDATAAGDSGAPSCDVGIPNGPFVLATTRGLVEGKAAGAVRAFLGIPYGAPTDGIRRFAAPEPAACWKGIKTTQAFGPACPQVNLSGPTTTISEDCLSINVWTPSTTPGAAAPVLMFMYGGANIIGGSNQAGLLGSLYDAQALAESQNAVVVTFNYRVGALGFVAHPALSATGPHAVSGNYGLQDAILALQWVKANIAHFGGDAGRVMFFGESAGAFNTCALVGSPLAANLFSSALMQSGACDAPTIADRYPRGLAFAKALKCDTASDIVGCLRAAPLADIVAATNAVTDPLVDFSKPIDVAHAGDMSFGASVDGYVLPDTPIHRIAAGTANPVPMVVGTNADEGNLFIPPGTVLNCLDYHARLQSAFGVRAAQVEGLYPCSVLNPTHGLSQLMTDLGFACPSRRTLRALAAANRAPAYRYQYVHTYSYGPLFALGAFHASEIPYVMGTFAGLGYAPTPAELGLSKAMQTYWANFAGTHDPNGGGLSYWAKYATARDNAITLDTTIASVDGIATKGCDYWDTLAPR